MDDVSVALDRIRELVEGARSMPMSASCVVNREELLALVDDARTQLPDTLRRARQVLGDKDAVVGEGRQEAERLLSGARSERSRILAQTQLVAAARQEAEQLVEEAREQAEAMRTDVEDYVEDKLANFEVVLTKTLRAVERGRRKLAGRSEFEALSADEVFGGPDPGS